VTYSPRRVAASGRAANPSTASESAIPAIQPTRHSPLAGERGARVRDTSPASTTTRPRATPPKGVDRRNPERNSASRRFGCAGPRVEVTRVRGGRWSLRRPAARSGARVRSPLRAGRRGGSRPVRRSRGTVSALRWLQPNVDHQRLERPEPQVIGAPPDHVVDQTGDRPPPGRSPPLAVHSSGAIAAVPVAMAPVMHTNNAPHRVPARPANITNSTPRTGLRHGPAGGWWRRPAPSPGRRARPWVVRTPDRRPLPMPTSSSVARFTSVGLTPTCTLTRRGPGGADGGAGWFWPA